MKILCLNLILFISLISIAQLKPKEEQDLKIELGRLVNELRATHRLKSLEFNDTLAQAAQFHSDYMVKNNVLGHEQKLQKYKQPKDRVEHFGGINFDYIGENVLYTAKVEFPLNSKRIESLAFGMFEQWKNSPLHFANMINSEYELGEFGFAVDSEMKVYATQVFARRGYVNPNRLSTNAFGITRAPADCIDKYKNFSNLVLNMGDDFRFDGNDVLFYYHNKQLFNRIFPDPEDGIAVDLLHRSQFECGQPNQMDVSLIHDGIMLKPTFRDEILTNNTAESDYRIISKIGELPSNLNPDDFIIGSILISNKAACINMTPVHISRKDYELREIEPELIEEDDLEFVQSGVNESTVLTYEFKTNNSRAIKNPTKKVGSGKLHSAIIRSYSSVEGDSIKNVLLHDARASYIKNHLQTQYGVLPESIQIIAEENWDMMNFQFEYFERDDLRALSHDSIKALIKSGDNSLNWDSLLFEQRISAAELFFLGEYYESDFQSLEHFNLRTAVAESNVKLANKALYEMFNSYEDRIDDTTIIIFDDLRILLEPEIFSFLNQHPETVANCAANLYALVSSEPYTITKYIHNWLPRFNELDKKAKSNLLNLYCLIGTFLLDNWDVPAKRLSNVIHPLKVKSTIPKDLAHKLLLNLHLTFIQYFGQINDSENIGISFYFIGDHFKSIALEQQDDVDLTLFFNKWSMYVMTIDHLLPKFKKGEINEDGVFILAETMNLYGTIKSQDSYIDVHRKASTINPQRWCNWLYWDFAVLKNPDVKQLYCQTCEE